MIAPVQALLGRAIDYAGMFPPAGLPLAEALDRYLRYRDSPDAWALGRFVLPAAQLDSLRAARSRHAADPERPVPLAVLIGPAIPDDLRRIEAFEASRFAHAKIESVEIRAGEAALAPVLGTVPSRWTRYVEIPLEGTGELALDAVASAGGFAKVRTGGTTAAGFPSAENLSRFLVAAAARGLAFKATAGLHHALRGSYRLGDEPDASSTVMFGYLNLALAAAMARRFADPVPVQAALRETDAASLHWEARAFTWRSHRFDPEALFLLRREFFHGFGSCSFREPLDELATLIGPQ